MTPGNFPNRWYLELDGKRMGPFAPEQILGLLAEGEIPEGLLVSPAVPGLTTQMTAAELRDAYHNENRIPTAPSADFQAPLRDIPIAADATSEERNSAPDDLATNRRLFDLFQSAKEKRAARFAPNVQAHAQVSHSSQLLSQPATWAAAVLMLVGSGIWGLNRSGTAPDQDRDPAQATPVESVSQQTQPPAHFSAPVPKPAQAPVVRNQWKPAPKAAIPVAKAIPRTPTRIAPRLPERRDSRNDSQTDDRRDDNRDSDDRNDSSNPSGRLVRQMGAEAGANSAEAPSPDQPQEAPENNNSAEGSPNSEDE